MQQPGQREYLTKSTRGAASGQLHLTQKIMKTETELQEILTRSRKFNIWSNAKTYNKSTGIGDCEYCGKKVGENPLYVHVTYKGTCLPNSLTAEEINYI